MTACQKEQVLTEDDYDFSKAFYEDLNNLVENSDFDGEAWLEEALLNLPSEEEFLKSIDLEKSEGEAELRYSWVCNKLIHIRKLSVPYDKLTTADVIYGQNIINASGNSFITFSQFPAGWSANLKNGLMGVATPHNRFNQGDLNYALYEIFHGTFGCGWN